MSRCKRRTVYLARQKHRFNDLLVKLVMLGTGLSDTLHFWDILASCDLISWRHCARMTEQNWQWVILSMVCPETDEHTMTSPSYNAITKRSRTELKKTPLPEPWKPAFEVDSVKFLQRLWERLTRSSQRSYYVKFRVWMRRLHQLSVMASLIMSKCLGVKALYLSVRHVARCLYSHTT